MSANGTNKLAGAKLEDVLAHCSLPDEAQALIAGAPDAAAVIGILTKNGFLVEATRVFAHALPKREAVWWACMCALHTAPEPLPEADAKARELAEQWVRSQADDVRRAAMDEATKAGFQSAEAWAGVAAFWSGDSMVPADAMQKVPPAPQLTGVAVAGAVALSAVRPTAHARNKRFNIFLGSAWDIAAGGSGRLAREGA
jgi:hypothetical protein